MTHVHLDFWSTNISEFRLKIVDFGMDGALGGGDDSEHEIAINANSMPAIGNSFGIALIYRCHHSPV